MRFGCTGACFGNAHFEHAVRLLCGNGIGLRGSGSVKRRRNVRDALRARPPLGLLRSACALDGEHALFSGDFDVLAVDTRQIHLHDETILFLAHIDRRQPANGGLRGLRPRSHRRSARQNHRNRDRNGSAKLRTVRNGRWSCVSLLELVRATCAADRDLRTARRVSRGCQANRGPGDDRGGDFACGYSCAQPVHGLGTISWGWGHMNIFGQVPLRASAGAAEMHVISMNCIWSYLALFSDITIILTLP